jgi:hypothetical protein
MLGSFGEGRLAAVYGVKRVLDLMCGCWPSIASFAMSSDLRACRRPYPIKEERPSKLTEKGPPELSLRLAPGNGDGLTLPVRRITEMR